MLTQWDVLSNCKVCSRGTVDLPFQSTDPHPDLKYEKGELMNVRRKNQIKMTTEKDSF